MRPHTSAARASVSTQSSEPSPRLPVISTAALGSSATRKEFYAQVGLIVAAGTLGIEALSFVVSVFCDLTRSASVNAAAAE